MYRRQTDWHFLAPYPLAPSYLIPWGGVHHYLYQFPPPSLLCLAARRASFVNPLRYPLERKSPWPELYPGWPIDRLTEPIVSKYNPIRQFIFRE